MQDNGNRQHPKRISIIRILGALCCILGLFWSITTGSIGGWILFGVGVLLILLGILPAIENQSAQRFYNALVGTGGKAVEGAVSSSGAAYQRLTRPKEVSKPKIKKPWYVTTLIYVDIVTGVLLAAWSGILMTAKDPMPYPEDVSALGWRTHFWMFLILSLLVLFLGILYRPGRPSFAATNLVVGLLYLFMSWFLAPITVLEGKTSGDYLANSFTFLLVSAPFIIVGLVLVAFAIPGMVSASRLRNRPPSEPSATTVRPAVGQIPGAHTYSQSKITAAPRRSREGLIVPIILICCVTVSTIGFFMIYLQEKSAAEREKKEWVQRNRVYGYAGSLWDHVGDYPCPTRISSLAYDADHNLLYAGTENHGVWKYHGKTWVKINGVVSSYWIESLASDSGHNLLYAGMLGNGVWKYDGTTWTDTGGDVSKYVIHSLAYDPGHNLLYAGTGDYGVWKYDGTTWTNTGGGVSSSGILSLAYDPGHNLLYAGTARTGHYGVWKYDGTTWTDTGGRVSSNAILSLAYDPGHNLLYAGMFDYGVWKYDGASWTTTRGEIWGYTIEALSYDPGHNLLYAGTGGNSVWKYDGASWTNIGGEVSSYKISSLAYDPVHNLLYAGTAGYVGGK